MAIGFLALAFGTVGCVLCLFGIGKNEKPVPEEKKRVYPNIIEL